MEFTATINPLLEAASYLGRKAGGRTWEYMESQISKRGFEPSAAFSEALNTLKQLTARLDKVTMPEDCRQLFANLEGFAHNTIGSASRAFLLLYGFVEEYQGDFSPLVRRAKAMTPGERAYHIAMALDMADDRTPQDMEDGAFLNMVLSLTVPDASKVAIMETYRDFAPLMAQLEKPMTRLLSALEQEKPAFEKLSKILEEKIRAEGCKEYLSRTSSLTPAEDIRYSLRPFVFGMDTDLTTDVGPADVCMYCGILREELLDMLSSKRSSRESIFDAFRLLGDRTRFELVCYLSNRSAYGQELSQHFDLSRNTIHHHMNKLSECGLVRCTADGNRIYYTLNRERFRLLLEQQRELLCEE